MSNWENIGFAPQDWQCPVCGAVYSPTTPMCYNCTGKTKTYTVSTGTQEVQSIEEYLKDLERTKEGR